VSAPDWFPGDAVTKECRNLTPEALAFIIRTRWEQRGHHIRVVILPDGYAIRSNLVDGLPPKGSTK
jgi:hypothetical protein